MGLVGVWHGTYVSAKNARTYIDAENIISDANKIKTLLSEVDNLSKSIYNSGSELTNEVLFIDDKDMSGEVGYTTQFISESKTAQVGLLDEIIQRATQLYNEKQEEYNMQAQAEDRRIAEQNRKK